MLNRIAIVSDWTTDTSDFMQFIHGFHNALPNAIFYTNPISPEILTHFSGLKIHTIKPDKIFGIFHNLFPALHDNRFKKLDMSKFDIIISLGYDAMKIQKTNPKQIHIYYCRNVPTPKKSDYQFIDKVDIFIADSTETQKEIKKHYSKPSTIIHPPVDVDKFEPARVRSNHYVLSKYQLSDDQINLAISAAAKLGIKLSIYDNNNDLQSFMTALNNAKGYISFSPESFNITQVYALAAGSPVIAYGKRDESDIVQDGESGILFGQQTVEDLTNALKSAERTDFLPGTLRRKSKRFNKSLFITKMRKIIYDQLV